MTFPWLEPTTRSAARTHSADKARKSTHEEISSRAGLLMRLGCSRKVVVSRLRASTEWEWEMRGAAPALKDIEKWVSEVFDRSAK